MTRNATSIFSCSVSQVEPAFENYANEQLPHIDAENVSITVIAGELEGLRSPISTYQELTYLDISADAGSSYEMSVDARHELAVYICEGAIDIGGTAVKLHDLAKLSPGDAFAFKANTKSRFILIGGEPLPEPTVIYWNFITDTIGEAKQKMIDWEDGKFPPVNKYRKISAAGDEDLLERMKYQ